MLFTKSLAAVCLLATAASVGAEPTRDARERAVQDAIDAFRPPKLPPKGEMPPVVVVLNPARTGFADPARRGCEELATLTAGYLYHLIRRAGGTAYVTQGYDTPVGGYDASIAALCRATRPHVFLRIDCGPASDRAPAGAFSHKLADGLRGPIEAAAIPDVFGIPAVQVCLAKASAGSGDGGTIPPHRAYAESLYEGVLACVRANRDALDRNRPMSGPTTAAAAPTPDELDYSPPGRIRRTARAVWPEGDLPTEKAPWFCSMYRATALSDRTILHFEPQALVEGDTVVLRGVTTWAPLRNAMEAALRVVGISNVRNEMRLLPDRARLDDRLFGVCVAPMALTYVRPAPTAGTQTQLLYGELLFLLDRDDGWWLVQAGDGYWGWVREDAVRPLDAAEFQKRLAAVPAVLRRDVDLGQGRVPRGSRLAVAARTATTVTLTLADGRPLDVAATDVRVIDDAAAADSRVLPALKLLYVPYVFGGRSPLGTDCSGLAGGMVEQAGLSPARDAAQQFAGGRLVATSGCRDAIRAGDQVFFVDAVGKVFHTGIAISPTHFVHSSPPCVQISSLRPGDRLYSPEWDRQFFAAKRP